MKDVSDNFPLFADIQTTSLLYFDERRASACYEFCQRRNIDCLPNIDDSYFFYHRNDETKNFDQYELSDDRRIDAYSFIFRSDLLERFQRHPVQFIFTHCELTGIVHFSDYNKDVVGTYLFAQLAKYERGLRRLAVLEGLNNEKMREFFENKKADPNTTGKDKNLYTKRLNTYASNRSKMEKAEEFQFFYMDDLIGLLGFQEKIQLDPDVKDLRDMIMHARSPIEMTDVHADDFIFDIESFEKFFNRVLTLLKDSKRVHNRIAFSEIKL
jgi:hypothetical protein